MQTKKLLINYTAQKMKFSIKDFFSVIAFVFDFVLSLCGSIT